MGLSPARDIAQADARQRAAECRLALAHAIGDKVEAAYRRGDLSDKRRPCQQRAYRSRIRPALAGK